MIPYEVLLVSFRNSLLPPLPRLLPVPIRFIGDHLLYEHKVSIPYNNFIDKKTRTGANMVRERPGMLSHWVSRVLASSGLAAGASRAFTGVPWCSLSSSAHHMTSCCVCSPRDRTTTEHLLSCLSHKSTVPFNSSYRGRLTRQRLANAAWLAR